ncbi:MAG: SpoIIE family protein phosphatase [Desulfobacterales bacterium]|nr:SpoIIE family protein phosphatase [Deltaproteobacteria bacterium]NNK94329.1 SpoIIE family protein phosphatase [Desulfobacterales bacterium]
MTRKTELTLVGLGFTAEESNKIVENSIIRFYPRNSVILSPPFTGESVFIIIEGGVQVLAINSENEEVTIAHYKNGEYFVGIEFSDIPNTTLVRAIEPSRLLELRMNWLKTLLPQASASVKQVAENMFKGLEKQGAKLSEAIQQKQAITDILRAISTSPSDLNLLLTAVVENAANLCDANDAGIMQVDNDHLVMVAKYGPSQLWPIGWKRKISRDWVTGRTVVDCKSIHILDLQAESSEFPEGAGYAKKYGHRTVYTVPLTREGVAIGAILIRRFKVAPVTEKQRDLLRTFSDQVTIAIENVRLFNEINEKSIQLKEQSGELAQWNDKLEFRVAEQVAQLEQFAKLEHELKVASDIQKSMLPRTIPEFEGYEIYANMIPAKTVGGDFYDFIPLSDDSLAIAIGDVADKGFPAALFMAMVRSFLRAETHHGVSPKKVLEGVNNHLLELNDKDIFVTILLGILNNKTKQFTYTRAGHELPVLVDFKGSVKQLHKGKGQALGVFDKLTLDEEHFNLSDKSMMVLYTDGITDAINGDNQMFGLQGLLHTVSDMPQQSVGCVCEELFRAVNKHQSHLPQYDDMTVIAVKAVGV